ncbi:hypothetical protein [Fluviicola sp.]|jgi:hypothetical protein|uniref:hypothetical protein n=1 Tax=Fluviicola sp. TaxID=1917219 RepID=UPI00281C5FF3|nr:hypothetical protein [Fluviicola sp.]MDR0803164.1 hypothetical protein [Fluviicola sp.]
MIKKINSIIVLISLLISTYSLSQTGSSNPREKKNSVAGFYGKRFTLQLGGGLHHNSLLKLFSSYERDYRKRDYYDTYRKQVSTDQFNYSLYGTIGYVVGKRTTLSVDFNYYFGNLILSNYGSAGYYDNSGNYISISGVDGRVKYNTFRIMPRIEINSNSNSAQMGLVNILGIGVEMSKAKSGSYKVIEPYANYNGGIYTTDLKFPDKNAFSFTALYGLEYRIPISRNIGWNIGGYAHLNLPLTGIMKELNADSYVGLGYSTNWDNEIRYHLVKNRLQNVFSVRTGIVIML